MHKKSLVYGLFCSTITALLWVLSIPPFEFSEAAYVAFVPLLLWIYTRPNRWTFLLVGFGTGWVSWCAILIWLRHVTYFGTLALSAILGLIFLLWLSLARWIVPGLSGRSLLVRISCLLGLAGAWVVLEWVRSWLFWGFPWAPLALSQWERPVVLQMAAWTGAYGVSFLLILFNLCIAQTLRKRFVRTQEKTLWAAWVSPELYLALGTLGLSMYTFFSVLPEKHASKTLFSAAVVQPYIIPELKWDQSRELENLSILERQTQLVANLQSDLILWPEAATPWPILGYGDMQAWVENLSNSLNKPILMGNLGHLPESEIWLNGSFLVEPETGLAKDYYVKRELVPFGEYVPKPFRFIDKFVPVGGDFTPGIDAGLISLNINGLTLKIGSLVCYEDAFPRLARESTRAGADVLYVATNNAWYGEEGGAPQHAAHSILRAVENRRPVMRAGNAGWSGWIDAYGVVREVLTDDEGSVYFRGGGEYTVEQYAIWSGRASFYTRHGDWFVWLCGGLSALSLVAVITSKLKSIVK